MVGRVALIGALLVGAVAVFLMTGGSGEGQEAECDVTANYSVHQFPGARERDGDSPTRP